MIFQDSYGNRWFVWRNVCYKVDTSTTGVILYTYDAKGKGEWL